MKIYTKTGDKGETALFGGERVSKNSLRIEAYGTIDELNSFIGLALVDVKDQAVIKLLAQIQNQLFTVGSDLATPISEKTKKLNIPRVDNDFIIKSENEIDLFDEKLEPLKNFILPGGTRSASILHICRTISRRAERQIVALSKVETINENIGIFINRISDLFFVLARYENSVANIPDIAWKKD